MNPDIFYIAQLLSLRQTGSLSDEEKAKLDEWMAADAANKLLADELLQEERVTQELQTFVSYDTNKSRAAFNKQFRSVGKIRSLRHTWLRVAAAVLLFISVGVGYLLLRQTTPETETAATNTPSTAPDILPGTNRATLVLGDESIIVLDTAANGMLARQGGSEVIKTDNGEIVYAGTETDRGNVFFQKLITPRGGQYQLTLADGTQVWLNAESSLRFPNVFHENTRTVELTGEAYFEVKSDKTKPFIVKTISEKITVLGTKFNVNAYANEIAKTSLLDGTVKIDRTILQPGQAFVNGKAVATDMQQDIAWKSGYFNFNRLSIDAAMRQVARWYDVDVRFENGIPAGSIFGKADRNLKLQELIKGYEGIIANFRLEAKTLYVNPIQEKNKVQPPPK